MIKVQYCKGDLKIQLKIPEDIYLNNSIKIYELLKDVLDNLSDSVSKEVKKQANNNTPLRGGISDRFFNIRDRIPNIEDDENVKVQKPKLDKALVRCPHCGQGFSAIVKINNEEMRLMIKKGDEFKTTKTIIKTTEELEKMLCPESISKKDYYDDLMNATEVVEEEKDIFVDLDTILICPCCHEKDRFSEWKNAFESPEQYFEYDNICDICGGEVDAVVTKEGMSFICSKCKTEIEKE